MEQRHREHVHARKMFEKVERYLTSTLSQAVARFLVAFDEDGKSERGAEALCSLSARMRRIQIPRLCPTDKDLTDFNKSGGGLRDWLQFELARAEHSAKPPATTVRAEDLWAFHQHVLSTTHALIRQRENATQSTWAEILRAVEAVQPDFVRAYHAAYVAADCDIYGRWKARKTRNEDLVQFREDLQAWQNALQQLLECHSKLEQ